MNYALLFLFTLQDTKILITDASTYLTGATYAIFKAINGAKVEIGKLAQSPVLLAKAVKNDVEAKGMMEAHVKDAVAVCKFASKLQEEIQAGSNWTEISAAELLLNYRHKQQHNRGASFHSISAFGSNGAIIHYLPTPETDKIITTDGLYMSMFIGRISIIFE